MVIWYVRTGEVRVSQVWVGQVRDRSSQDKSSQEKSSQDRSSHHFFRHKMHLRMEFGSGVGPTGFNFFPTSSISTPLLYKYAYITNLLPGSKTPDEEGLRREKSEKIKSCEEAS